jgi:hypothetical protein
MNVEARDKVTEILGFAPSFESETVWIWKTTIGEFSLAPKSDGSFIVLIHNLKEGTRTDYVCSGIDDVIEFTTQHKSDVDLMKPDVERYIQVMGDIKWRAETISHIDSTDRYNKGKDDPSLYRYESLMPLAVKIEAVALQIRRIIESIALASLVANEPLYKEEAEKFKKFWRTEQIFEYIEKRNPDFYPKPIKHFEARYESNIESKIQFIEDGFMTRDMCIEVYKKCSHIVHPQNPFAEDKYGDYENFYSQVRDWINHIVRLLNCHVFRLVGSNDFYVVHMADPIIDLTNDYGGSISRPFMYPLRLDKLSSEIQAKLRGERETK